MPRETRQAASALLLTLIMTASVATLLLAGGRLVLRAAAGRADVADADMAYQMAMQGIDEGYARFGAIGQEYGWPVVTATNYSLYPMRRGYKPGTNCQTAGKAFAANTNLATEFDPQCPYYDMAVRQNVDSPKTVSAPATALRYYSSREIPNGVLVHLVTGTPGQAWTSVQLAIVTDGTGATSGRSYTVNKGGYEQSYPVSSTTTNISQSYSLQEGEQLFLRLDGWTNYRVEIRSTYSGRTLIDKGYTTIEAEGHSGRVTRRLILYYRPNDGAPGKSSKELYEVSSVSDPSGCRTGVYGSGETQYCPNFKMTGTNLTEKLQ